MPTVQYSVSISGGGVSINRLVPRTNESLIGIEVALAAGPGGTLTTRTDDNTGEATMSGGHGITTGQIIDVYWTGGKRIGMTVGTVATNAVPLDGGTGDVLPAATTALRVMVPVVIAASIDGDALDVLGIELAFNSISETSEGTVAFQDAAEDVIATVDLTANIPQVWDIASGATNPFTGDAITAAVVSHGSTSAATLKIVGVQDVTA